MAQGIAMNWEAIGALAELLGATGVIVSLVYLATQIRTNNALVKAQKAQALVELSSPFNMELARSRNFAELWLNGVPPEADAVDRFRHQSLLGWWLILHENIYGQWKSACSRNSTISPGIETCAPSFRIPPFVLRGAS